MNLKNILRILCVISDYILLLASLALVVYFRTPSMLFSDIIIEYFKIFCFLFLGWIFLFYLFDLYNFNVPPRFTRFVLSLITCILFTTMFFYVFPNIAYISPKTNLALIGVVFSLVYYVWRRIFDFIFVHVFHGHSIMMAISDDNSLKLACMLHENKRHKYHVLGVLTNKEYYKQVIETIPADIVYLDFIEFKEALVSNKTLTLVATDKWYMQLYDMVYNLFPQHVRMINVVNFYERVMQYIPVYNTSQYWIMMNMDMVSRRLYMTVKRICDIIFALILLPFFVGLIILVACIIKLFGEKRGTVFFKQTRVGLHNKEFLLYKFRTMYTNAEESGAKWAVKDDSRVTRIGKLLRLTRLDELPQIWNVLKGDMSFIGPRPERQVFVDMLVKEIPHYQLRHLIRPGLSGWAQVKFEYGSSVEDAATKLCYDLYYIKNMNIFLDIKIILYTIPKVFTAGGR